MEEQRFYAEQSGYSCSPEASLPRTIPGSLPESLPNSLSNSLPGALPGSIVLPPDWWRCLRLGCVSGRYEGDRTAPTAGGTALDLRVDIDPRSVNSPVMNRVSGDFYRIFQINLPGRPPIRWRVYQSSWIVDSPTVTWFRCRVEITGTVRFWQGSHPVTTVQINIPWGTFQAAGPAEVTFTEAEGSTSSYSCVRRSENFREMTLEVDVCQSVNAEPIVPIYDTSAHATRPADLPQRTLTVEEAFREAGLNVSIRPDRTIIDDSDPAFDRWSPAELHDAMETNFSQFSGSWPAWQMWGLLAGRFDSLSVGGIMYDAGAAYGGAGAPPDRQGFAVFRNHAWFNNLVSGTPANQDQAWAMRQFLYTWVHEAGHAFNFLHSWNKGRPDSLSWMNYPQNVANFWENFRFRFDDDELIHLRHGDRASVIMGGDPWASGGHAEALPEAMVQIEGQAPLELLLRSKEYFEFMEEVTVEVRLRNLLEDLPLDVDTRLSPEDGTVILYIRRPDGQIMEYAPIFCQLGTPQMRTLKPRRGGQGTDRYSTEIALTYGKYGFNFAEPGEYQLRAVYQGAGDVLIPSNVHRIRIGRPFSKEEDRIAQDFFSYPVGMSLYLKGSQSPFLAKGMDVLRDVADRFPNTALADKAVTTLANSIAKPFFRLQENVLTQTHTANPEEALKLTTPVLERYQQAKARSFNLPYHQLVRQRSHWLLETGHKADAKNELATLQQDLQVRGVHEPILSELKLYESSL